MTHKLSPTIGILAGMGPRSTAAFIDLVVTECQILYGAHHDSDFPKMVICAQPAPFFEAHRPIDHASLEAAVRAGLKTLEDAGASFMAMASNTAHLYYPKLAAASKVPLLNMVELTVSAAPESTRRLAVVAARPTAESNLYQDGFRRRGFHVVDIDWQKDIDRILSGRTSSDPIRFRSLWSGIVDRATKARVDALVVACLDLSALLAHAGTGMPILDASRCLAQTIVKTWLAARPAA